MSKSAPAPAPEATKPQPKILQKMLLRFAIGLFVLATLFGAYRWWSGYAQDPDLPAQAETVGMIAALELGEEGTQVVVFEPDGDIRKSPGFAEENTDKELIWRPDGNRLFFVSDREEDAFNIYRWNLASDKVMRRSVGSRSQSTPTFAPQGAPGENDTLLLTSGGFVLELDPRTSTTRQVLPPVGKEREAGDEGSGSQFEAFYKRLGTSFRKAKWSKDKNFVAAVLRREDEGEILIVQNMKTLDPPLVVMAGDHVEFDFNPTNGQVAFAVSGFKFHDPAQIPPEAIKDGKVQLPFQALIGLFDPEAKRLMFVMPSADPNYAFHYLSVSPDGSQILFVAGKMDENNSFQPEALLTVPARDRGGEEVKRILRGQIYEPSWGPDSHAIVFVQRDAKGKRNVYTINKDGSGQTDIGKGRGDFAWPQLSPKKS